MKAITHVAPGQTEWREWPDPLPGPGQVRIRTVACGICATDLEMINGWQRTKCPAIPGHEWAGVVDQVGPGADASLGGRPCVAENVLADGGEVGFEHPGGYGEYLVTEAGNVYPLPPDFPLWTAVLIEPLAVCVRGWNRLRLSDRGRALILGDGPVGLLMVSLLKHFGVEELCLVGGRPVRLTLARELGAAQTLNYHDVAGPLAPAIRAAFRGDFPAVLEVSGSPAALAAALELTPVGGKVLVIGDYGDARADFRWTQLLHRELELIGSNASAGGWPQAVALATTGAIPLARLISHRLPAARFAEGIELARHSREALKVVLEWCV